MIREWEQQQVSAFLALRGRVIRSWHGVEMAVRGEGPDAVFGGPDVPCLQLLTLGMTFATGSAAAVGTYQDNDLCGLAVNTASGRAGDDLGPGFRLRAMPELPTGEVRAVSAYFDGDVLAEVGLHVDDQQLLLVAGEAHEDSSGRLVWHRGDESVLVFAQPQEAEALVWVPVRRPLHRAG